MAEASSIAAHMDIDEAAIDEGLYSRQLWVVQCFLVHVEWAPVSTRYVLGHEGMWPYKILEKIALTLFSHEEDGCIQCSDCGCTRIGGGDW